jgi:hypothetical protein
MSDKRVKRIGGAVVGNVAAQILYDREFSLPEFLKFVGPYALFATLLDDAWAWITSWKWSNNPHEDILEREVGRLLFVLLAYLGLNELTHSGSTSRSISLVLLSGLVDLPVSMVLTDEKRETR